MENVVVLTKSHPATVVTSDPTKLEQSGSAAAGIAIHVKTQNEHRNLIMWASEIAYSNYMLYRSSTPLRPNSGCADVNSIHVNFSGWHGGSVRLLNGAAGYGVISFNTAEERTGLKVMDDVTTVNPPMSSGRKRWRQICVAGLIGACVLTAQVEPSVDKRGTPRPPAKIFYAPKPVQPMPYLAPMKPFVRLADLKARHAGHANWSELVVYDKNNRAEVISAAPGSKVPRHLHSDAPEYWVVQEGKIRFEIEDPPGKFQSFEAGPGDLVLAPERHLHSLEVIGSQPAIRFEVTLPDTTVIYEAKPEQPEKGMEYTPVTLSTGNNPDEVPNDGKPDRVFSNIDQLQKEQSGRRSWSDLAVRKNRAHANIICGYGSDMRHVSGDLGHYHTDFAEIWIILRGQQRFAIEGLDPFVAAAGDIVYAPRNGGISRSPLEKECLADSP